MECMSCQEQVSEKFLHAIANNCCCFCGQHIMPEELQTLLNGLMAVMHELETKSFLSEAEAWLKQNFDLISANSNEYVSLTADLAVAQDQVNTLTTELATVKKKLDDLEKNPLRNAKALLNNGEEPAEGGTTIQVADPTKTNDFMKRAEVSKLVSKTAELKKVADKIKAAGGTSGISSLAVPMMSDTVVDEYEEDYEPYDDTEEPLDPVAEQLIAMGSGGNSGAGGGYNAKDVQMLKNLQAKQRAAARGISRGGAGMFSRSS